MTGGHPNEEAIRVKESLRVPGPRLRYIAAEKLDDDRRQLLHKYEVHGDGAPGIPVRSARRIDGLSAGRADRNSPLV